MKKLCIGICGGTHYGYKKYQGYCKLDWAWEIWHIKKIKFNHEKNIYKVENGKWKPIPDNLTDILFKKYKHIKI